MTPSYINFKLSKVLLDGLYDTDSPLCVMLGVRGLLMKKIWDMLGAPWQFFPEEHNAED